MNMSFNYEVASNRQQLSSGHLPPLCPTTLAKVPEQLQPHPYQNLPAGVTQKVQTDLGAYHMLSMTMDDRSSNYNKTQSTQFNRTSDSANNKTISQKNLKQKIEEMRQLQTIKNKSRHSGDGTTFSKKMSQGNMNSDLQSIDDDDDEQEEQPIKIFDDNPITRALSSGSSGEGEDEDPI